MAWVDWFVTFAGINTGNVLPVVYIGNTAYIMVLGVGLTLFLLLNILPRFNFNMAWVSNLVSNIVYDEIYNWFTNINGRTFEVWE